MIGKAVVTEDEDWTLTSRRVSMQQIVNSTDSLPGAEGLVGSVLVGKEVMNDGRTFRP